jgi:hypothetical protein
MDTHKVSTRQTTIKKQTVSSAKKRAVREAKLKSLNDLIGIGKGIWKEDAQEYINRLRKE